MSSLPEGEWAVAASQRGMMQNKVKVVRQGSTAWKTSIVLRERDELLTGGWVIWCWIPEKDDVENEKNDYKRDKENIMNSFNFFFIFMKQHGMHDIKVTDYSKVIQWRWSVSSICQLYC